MVQHILGQKAASLKVRARNAHTKCTENDTRLMQRQLVQNLREAKKSQKQREGEGGKSLLQHYVVNRVFEFCVESLFKSPQFQFVYISMYILTSIWC